MSKEKLRKTFRKPGKPLLGTTLKDYKKIEQLGEKI